MMDKFKNTLFKNCNPLIMDAMQNMLKSRYTIYLPKEAGDKNTFQYLTEKMMKICSDIIGTDDCKNNERRDAFWFSHNFHTVIAAVEALNNDEPEEYLKIQDALVRSCKVNGTHPYSIYEDDGSVLIKILTHPDIAGHLKKIAFFDEAERIRLQCSGNPQKTADILNNKIKNNEIERS